MKRRPEWVISAGLWGSGGGGALGAFAFGSIILIHISFPRISERAVCNILYWWRKWTFPKPKGTPMRKAQKLTFFGPLAVGVGWWLEPPRGHLGRVESSRLSFLMWSWWTIEISCTVKMRNDELWEIDPIDCPMCVRSKFFGNPGFDTPYPS